MQCTLDNNVLVKYVLFNSSSVDWWLQPSTGNSNWVSIALHKQLAQFDPAVPVDLVVSSAAGLIGAGGRDCRAGRRNKRNQPGIVTSWDEGECEKGGVGVEAWLPCIP